MPWVLDKMANSRFLLCNPGLKTTRRFPSGPTHAWLQRLLGMPLKLIQVWNPVARSHKRLGPLGSKSRSNWREQSTLRFFCSSVKRWGTHLAARFLMWRSSWRMLCIVPTERSHASLNSRMVECGSSSIRLLTRAMFCSFRTENGRPGPLPALEGPCSLWKASTHLKTVLLLHKWARKQCANFQESVLHCLQVSASWM